MKRIAFIGLGKMGAPMVQNLLKHGYLVTVFDIVPAAIKSCVDQGAQSANSPQEAVQNAEAVWTMLQTGEQVKGVCLGENGIFQKLSSNTLYIDSSSIDIESTRCLHQQAAQNNIAMLDAPVSGGVKGATDATLTIMVGGSPENFERAKLLLNAVGKNVYYAGALGNGQAAKICNNMILGINMIAVSEAFTLAEKLGLDPKTFFEISSHASGACWAMIHYNPVPGVIENVPANNRYQPGFTAAMMLKDLKLSQEAAKLAHVATQMGAKATELYQQWIDHNYGQLDFSSIIQMLQDS
ncbi:MAG: 3-hydroxyisobutyrate dehydrogenase [Proteobacteria bacterium]|nr:3-hydroxyisobutyrate dehydrogenase [Pseudomonadota bacterium]